MSAIPGARPRAWPGVVKVKLLHRAGGSVLAPEVVIVGGAQNQWVQPQFFYAPQLALLEDGAVATVHVAAVDPARRSEEGLDLRLSFSRGDRIASLPDRSEVYRCQVFTSHSPAELAVGRARVRADGGIDLKLHHHTASDSLRAIHATRHVRGSSWNHQGNLELANVSYADFTSLRRIASEGDLQRIAMGSAGSLFFRLDTNTGPVPDLVLDVYRETTGNRRATLTLWVPAEIVSTPHVWRHAGPPVLYEVSHPWVQRVGLEPGGHLDFDGIEATPDATALKAFDYAVVGDCTTLAGLRAPYEEEDTSETFAVQDLSGTDLFDFWFANANTPLHAPPADPQTLRPPASP